MSVLFLLFTTVTTTITGALPLHLNVRFSGSLRLSFNEEPERPILLLTDTKLCLPRTKPVKVLLQPHTRAFGLPDLFESPIPSSRLGALILYYVLPCPYPLYYLVITIMLLCPYRTITLPLLYLVPISEYTKSASFASPADDIKHLLSALVMSRLVKCHSTAAIS
jgi:hypothetical protein